MNTTYISKGDLRMAFAVFDEDNNGKLSKAEIAAILSRGGNKMLTEEEVAEVVETFDKNGDGMLSLEEVGCRSHYRLLPPHDLVCTLGCRLTPLFACACRCHTTVCCSSLTP